MTIYIRISGQKVGRLISRPFLKLNTNFLKIHICDFEKAFDFSKLFVGANTDI